MSSASYTFARAARDEALLFRYVKATFPTLTALYLVDASSVRLTFSGALSAPQQASLSALLDVYPDPMTTEESTTACLSVFNTTSAPLGANGVFTGAFEDCSRYSTLRVCVLSNAASAAGGLSVQFGLTAAQADSAKSYTLLAGTPLVAVTGVEGRYFRVVYTNGASAQTSFSLSTRWSTTSEPPVAQLGASVADQTDAVVVKSALIARTDYATYSSLRANEESRLHVHIPTRFRRQQHVNSVPWIQICFTYGINTDNCNTAVAGGGSVTASNSMAVVASAAAANASAQISTDRICFCAPGNTVLAVVSAAFAVGVAGNTQLVGAGTTTNGLFFGMNGTSLGVACRSNGITTWVAQASWNVDRMNGTGPSGITLNPTFGNTYAIQYDALGFGNATFMVYSPPSNVANPKISMDDFVVVHRQFFNNASGALGVQNPQFPLTAISSNTTAASAVAISVASFCCFVETDLKNTLMHSLEFTKSINSSTFVPALVLFNKPTFNGVASTTTVLIREIGFAMGGVARGDSLLVLRDPVMTALGTLVDVSASSCVSYSNSATSTVTAGTGVPLYSSVIYSTHDHFDVSDLGLYISPGSYMCFAARTCAGNAAATNNTVCVTWSEI